MKTDPLSGKKYPNDHFTRDRVQTLLLLVDEPVPAELIDAWGTEDLHDVGDWAWRNHLRASDNNRVRIPARPKQLGV